MVDRFLQEWGKQLFICHVVIRGIKWTRDSFLSQVLNANVIERDRGEYKVHYNIHIKAAK